MLRALMEMVCRRSRATVDVESQRREWRRLPRKAQMAIIGILGILTVNKVNLNFKLNLKHTSTLSP